MCFHANVHRQLNIKLAQDQSYPSSKQAMAGPAGKAIGRKAGGMTSIILPLPAEHFHLIQTKRDGLELCSDAKIRFKPEDGGIRPLVIHGTEDQCCLASTLIRDICPSAPNNIEIQCRVPVDVGHHAQSFNVWAERKVEFGNLSVWGLTGKVEDVKKAANAIREAHREMCATKPEGEFTRDAHDPKVTKKRRMAKSKEEQRPLEVVKPWQSNDEETQNKSDLSYLKATLDRIMQLYERPHNEPLRKKVQAALRNFGIQQIDEEKLEIGDYERLDQACKKVAELIYEVECMLQEPPRSMFAISDKPKQAETPPGKSSKVDGPGQVDAVQKRSLAHDQACEEVAELMYEVECTLQDLPIATSDKPKQAEKPPGKSSSGCVRGAPR